MKYIFTENQVKKIIDNQLNEDAISGMVKSTGMNTPSVGGLIKSSIRKSKSGNMYATSEAKQKTYLVTDVKGSPKSNGVVIIKNKTKLNPDDILEFSPNDEVTMRDPSQKQYLQVVNLYINQISHDLTFK